MPATKQTRASASSDIASFQQHRHGFNDGGRAASIELSRAAALTRLQAFVTGNLEKIAESAKVWWAKREIVPFSFQAVQAAAKRGDDRASLFLGVCHPGGVDAKLSSLIPLMKKLDIRREALIAAATLSLNAGLDDFMKNNREKGQETNGTRAELFREGSPRKQRHSYSC